MRSDGRASLTNEGAVLPIGGTNRPKCSSGLGMYILLTLRVAALFSTNVSTYFSLT